MVVLERHEPHVAACGSDTVIITSAVMDRISGWKYTCMYVFFSLENRFYAV